MEREYAESFVRHWVHSWNNHDLEAVMSHFAEEVVFTSLHAMQLLPETGGVVRGKAALRRYWEAGLARRPDLHFEVLGIYVGVATLVINYSNQQGGLASEVLQFSDGLVIEGHGTFIEKSPYHSPL